MKILMVCLGNICRSPLAEGILKHKIQAHKLDWEVDSAGTSGWHVGELPNINSIQVAQQNGLDITDQRSRQFVAKDLETFDLILAMDADNYNNILSHTTPDQAAKVKMILNYSYPNENRRVPDPYYEGGFDKVFALLDEACEQLIKTIVQ